MKIPFLIVITSMALGVFIAILFGVNESIFKDKIAYDLSLNQKIQSITDPQVKTAKLSKEKSKNWRYYQRFHFHSTGISAMSLGVLLLLLFSTAPRRLKKSCAYMVSVGGFLYPFVWLFAAIYGPVIGRGAAKEKFAVFGYMGGVFLLGLFLLLYLIAKYPMKMQELDS